MPRQVEANYRRKTDYGESDLAKLGLSAESHNQWPNQIKLFLNRERPGYAQQPCGVGWSPNQNILKKYRIRPPGSRPRFEYSVGVRWPQERYNHKHEEQGGIIQRPNPKTAPDIE